MSASPWSKISCGSAESCRQMRCREASPDASGPHRREASPDASGTHCRGRRIDAVGALIKRPRMCCAVGCGSYPPQVDEPPGLRSKQSFASANDPAGSSFRDRAGFACGKLSACGGPGRSPLRGKSDPYRGKRGTCGAHCAPLRCGHFLPLIFYLVRAGNGGRLRAVPTGGSVACCPLPVALSGRGTADG